MPLNRDSSSTGRRSRGRVRPDTLPVGARAPDTDGVLVLHPEGNEPPPPPASTDGAAEDAMLASLCAERDAALEKVAYLEEQLRSLSAYHAHLLDEERRRMFVERTQRATELESLQEELQRRTYPGPTGTRGARGPLTTGSDGDSAGTP